MIEMLSDTRRFRLDGRAKSQKTQFKSRETPLHDSDFLVIDGDGSGFSRVL